MVGYRAAMSANFGVQVQAGFLHLMNTTYTTSIGGRLEDALPFAGPAAETEFDQAKQDIDNQVRSGVDAVQRSAKWLPAFSLVLSYLF